MKELNILICGLGSVGQRHLRILKSLKHTFKINLYCIRSKKKNLVIDDNLNTFPVKSLVDFYNIKEIQVQNNFKFDIVYITNPISNTLT